MDIVVLGMHRSGTSTVTRLINMMGAYVGNENELIGANDENPKGFWERADVIALNDALLALHGCNWYNLATWPYRGDEIVDGIPVDLENQMKVISKRLHAHPVAVMKDPRMCHTLPMWKPYLVDPVYVIIHRDPLEISRSLQTRNEFTFSHALALWEYAVTGIFNGIDRKRSVFMNYQQFIEQPVESVSVLYERLAGIGVPDLHLPSNETITDFIEPSLRRSRVDEMSAEKVMSGYQRELAYSLENGEIPPIPSLVVCQMAREIMQSSVRAQAMQMGKAASEEALGRALTTIREQEAVIAELYRKYDAEILELNYLIKDLRESYELVESERNAMQVTRWWRLRDFLLGVKERLAF